jgi:hypothetical protein
LETYFFLIIFSPTAYHDLNSCDTDVRYYAPCCYDLATGCARKLYEMKIFRDLGDDALKLLETDPALFLSPFRFLSYRMLTAP